MDSHAFLGSTGLCSWFLWLGDSCWVFTRKCWSSLFLPNLRCNANVGKDRPGWAHSPSVLFLWFLRGYHRGCWHHSVCQGFKTGRRYLPIANFSALIPQRFEFSKSKLMYWNLYLSRSTPMFLRWIQGIFSFEGPCKEQRNPGLRLERCSVA